MANDLGRVPTAPGIPETWKDCPDYVGLYEVSDRGRLRSLYFDPPRILAFGSDSHGYPTVALSKDKQRTTKTVHRLVCRAFHGEPFSIWNEAAHLDGDRTNPRADNLQWVNKVANHHHQRAHGTHMARELHPRAKLTEAAVAEIRASSGPRRPLAEKFGVSVNTISDVRNGRRWTFGGSVHDSAVPSGNRPETGI